jgi:hypothetical protein
MQVLQTEGDVKLLQQEVHLKSTKVLMPFRKVIGVYYENNTKQINHVKFLAF